MRTLLITLIVLSFAAMPVQAATGDMAPDWTLATAEGSNVTLSQEVEQQATLLFFWATWCPYCKALMPHLQSMQLEHGKNLKILAITIREDGDPEAVLRDAAYNFTLLPDGDEVAEEFGVRGTPSVYLVDCDRRIRFDLSEVISRDLPPSYKGDSNTAKAAFRAPYWAAEIRKALATVMNGEPAD